jgi:ribosomal protein S18 acetylase RimI-like enzyme
MGSQKLVDDLGAMLDLACELWSDDSDAVGHPYGEVAWWAASIPHGETEARLWFDDGRLVGWGWVTGGTELEFEVRPSHRDLLAEILAWAQPHEVVVRADNADAIARIRAFGLVHDPAAPWTRLNARSLEHVAEPCVPEGYRVRTVREGDWSSRAAAHRSAFHPSRLRDEVYEFVRATPAYRAGLDCVVEAPDGSIAAFTLAWLDDRNGVGQFEPVGTHADHRRLGLARAVGLYALRRLREEGATSALVSCRGDEAYPIPCKLYESIGFRECARSIPFRRPAANRLSASDSRHTWSDQVCPERHRLGAEFGRQPRCSTSVAVDNASHLVRPSVTGP